MAVLTKLEVPGTEEDWRALGFEVSAEGFQVGRVSFRCGATRAGWGFADLHADPSRLGVSTEQVPAPKGAVHQPNGIDRIDHVVFAVPDLDNAVVALTDVLGEAPRRRARPRGPQGPEMAFFRAGDGFIEVVGGGGESALWGIAFSAPDLDATVEAIRAAGGPVGEAKPSVQGGRIASAWRGHLGWGVAIMEPPADRRRSSDAQGPQDA